jgi:hypothetical protein
MMPYYGKTVTSSSLKNFEDLEGPKFLLISGKKKPTAIIKALTSEFRGRMEFGFVHKDQKEVVSAYSPPKLPCFIALKDNAEHEVFNGEFTFESMAEFV